MGGEKGKEKSINLQSTEEKNRIRAVPLEYIACIFS
jgi:hypothetical protein